MWFSEKILLIKSYHKWLDDTNKLLDFKMADCYENFIYFLELKGLLRQVQPGCELLHAQRNCDEYSRRNNFTCDWSNKCASCRHNMNIGGYTNDRT